MEIFSFSSFGYDGEIIKIEADLRRGLPVTDIVGLPGSAVKESKERVRAAIRNSELEFPNGRILINLSPADKKKEGSGFDVPIALAILTAKDKATIKDSSQKKDAEFTPQQAFPIMIMGELELSGKIRSVRGVLGAISTCSEQGIKYFIVPKENEAEASIPESAKVFGANSLTEALEFFYQIENTIKQKKKANIHKRNFLKGTEKKSIQFTWSENEPEKFAMPSENLSNKTFSFEDIKGQDKLIRALQVAATGGHNLIAYGPPGCGKTISLSRFVSLLPDMDCKTALEATRIYSIAGLLANAHDKKILLRRPPFRMPHPNASMEGMIGGAGKCMPGEISLAHGGVLFLDEATQFKSTVLQTLRAPLETGRVTLSRAGRSSTFPSDFQLLVAINPCPCGNFGTKGKICTCLPHEVENYWKKLAAPLLDRIDIRIPVLPPSSEALLKPVTHSTQKIRETIKTAKLMQLDRAMFFSKEKKINYKQYNNANIAPQDTAKICKMSDEAKRIFSATVSKKNLSGRGSHAILKISRSVADIEKTEKLSAAHIEEAIALREWLKYLPCAD